VNSESSSSSVQDPFIFDFEQLLAITTEGAITQGLKWFKEHRVTELYNDEQTLSAQVEDPEYQEPLSTSVSYSSDGNLLTCCECNDNSQPVCSHVAALLYAYSAQSENCDELVGAVDSAIEERIKSGRNEVQTTHLGGELWFGAWRASSVNASNPFPRKYRVNIRSLQRRGNYCSCPDFATNQLGTCKHIEGVLHRISKRCDYAKIKQQIAPLPYVYLNWKADNPPQIALHRTASLSGELASLLNQHFNATGLFTGNLPDDFFRFAEQVQDREDLDLGEDAKAHAHRIATNQAQRIRAVEISQQIKSSGGHLPGIQARLYPYQVEGVAFLAANGRALLADDMGLGKTLQAIAAALWLRDHAQAKRILVICPASLKQQWAREIHHFTGLPSHVVQGSPEIRHAQYRKGDGFYIINYELLLRDLSLINEKLQPDLLILDEAQRIKNWRTKVASAVKRIPSTYAFVLTGTPLENRLEDLYSLMQVVDCHLLGPLWRYMIDFHVTNDRGKIMGYRNLSELRRRLTPAMLRRDRSLIKDQLPARITQQLDISLTAMQQELHDAALSTAGQLANRAKKRPLTPAEQNKLMAALQQARMACNAAGLVDKETEGSPKLDELATLLEELCLQSDHKAVIFSQWELMTQMVERLATKMGIGSVRLHGGVPTAKRGALIDRFREDESVQLFISTDAGGVGLNLQTATVLINLDIPWNPAVLEQRIARIHRLGQKSTVQVVLMVASDAYEGRVMQLVQGKQELFDNVIDPDASEDVVGVSKKLLETLTEDLGVGESAPKDEAINDAPQPVPDLTDTATGEQQAKTETDETLRYCIEQLQQAFSSRIERILGTGGGLLVVLDQVDAEADLMAVQISKGQVPIALIDLRTLRSLQRLGAASPVAEASTHYEGVQSENQSPQARQLQRATEHLNAAEVLIAQQCSSSAIELIISALLTATAAKAQLEQPPTPADAGVWIYTEIMPREILTQAQVGTIMHALTLAQATTLPAELLQGVLKEARLLIVEM